MTVCDWLFVALDGGGEWSILVATVYVNSTGWLSSSGTSTARDVLLDDDVRMVVCVYVCVIGCCPGLLYERLCV